MQYSAGKSLMQLDANFVSKHPHRSSKPTAASPTAPLASPRLNGNLTVLSLHLHEHATPQSTVTFSSLAGHRLETKWCSNSHSPVSTLHHTTLIVPWTHLDRVVLSQITHRPFVLKGGDAVLNHHLFFRFRRSFFLMVNCKQVVKTLRTTICRT